MKFFKFLISKQFIFQILLAIFLVVGVVFGLKYWLGATTNHQQKIEVPNLERLIINDVQTKLEQLNLTYTVIDSANYNQDYPKKSVIEQDPEPGDFVKEKRRIYLTLNPSKYRDVSIPDVIGRTKRQASSQLRAAGFKIGTNFIYINDIGKDVVRGMRFKNKIVLPKEKLPLNSVIDLVLGDGKGR